MNLSFVARPLIRCFDLSCRPVCNERLSLLALLELTLQTGPSSCSSRTLGTCWVLFFRGMSVKSLRHTQGFDCRFRLGERIIHELPELPWWI